MEKIKDFIEEANKAVYENMNTLYGMSQARAMRFLYDNVSREVQLRFVNTYMNPETTACFASSSIVVRVASRQERKSYGSAHYIISAVDKDGNIQPLKFGSKVATVYYLMYLISRKQQSGKLKPIDLARNRLTFVALYHTAYNDISHTQALVQHQRLLYRVVDKKIRAGYKAQVECDIRRHLAQAFATFRDSPIPFGMSKNSHLTVNPDRIIFKGEAHRLTYYKFD